MRLVSPPAPWRDFPTRGGPPAAPLRSPAPALEARRIPLRGETGVLPGAPLLCSGAGSATRVYERTKSLRLLIGRLQDQFDGENTCQVNASGLSVIHCVGILL